jgi:hypothetical protein
MNEFIISGLLAVLLAGISYLAVRYPLQTDSKALSDDLQRAFTLIFLTVSVKVALPFFSGTYQLLFEGCFNILFVGSVAAAAYLWSDTEGRIFIKGLIQKSAATATLLLFTSIL